MEQVSTITILGTGYVGLTTAALTAMAGIKTYVVDTNQARLASVRAGKSFFYEEGLDPLIAQVVQKGMLVPTDSYAESVPQSDVVLSSVGTPDNPDGSSNLTYVFAAAKEAAQYLKPDAVYVQKSTVPVGTGAKVQQLFAEAGISVAYVSNPEFLRESTALHDSLWFDRIVVGGNDVSAMERVQSVYRAIEQKRAEIARAAGLDEPAAPPQGEYVTVNLESAELIKVTANAFLALKISFANSIAQLSDKVGADVTQVMDAVGADPRIGRAFLNAGRGYGGGCFPKDVSGLIAAGLEHGVDLEIMRAAQAVNETMPGYILEKLQHELDDTLQGRMVAVLGLSFKAGTSDTRRSPGIAMANRLAAAGVQVRAFDPKAHEEAVELLDKRVQFADDVQAALASADAVIVATDWAQFVGITPADYAAVLSKNAVFVDALNRFDPGSITEASMRYIGVGRSAS